MRPSTLSAAAAILLGLAATLPAAELKVGDKAPAFALPGTDGKTHSLADHQGKQWVVLAWFPKADTPGCTAECKSFTAKASDLKSTGAAYYTASVDPVPDNQKFSQKYNFNFPILSDPDKKTAEAYGVLSPRGTAQRWTFYIDPEGTIRHIDKTVISQKAADDVVARLKQLAAK